MRWVRERSVRFPAGLTPACAPAITRHMTENEAAVLEAARKWLEAKEEMLAADEGREDPVETELALDKAEYDLVAGHIPVARARAETPRG